jgi:hypothetical protein
MCLYVGPKYKTSLHALIYNIIIDPCPSETHTCRPYTCFTIKKNHVDVGLYTVYTMACMLYIICMRKVLSKCSKRMGVQSFPN